jgi:hypothetical protein
MTVFDINELLKEDLVKNYGAVYAKTIFFKEGLLIIPEAFYETSVLWNENTDIETMKNTYKVILEYKKKVDKNYYMTSPIFEYSLGRPNFIWSTFLSRDPETAIYD